MQENSSDFLNKHIGVLGCVCPFYLPDLYLRLGGGTLGSPACSERGSGVCNILYPRVDQPRATPTSLQVPAPDWGREGHTEGAGRTSGGQSRSRPTSTLQDSYSVGQQHNLCTGASGIRGCPGRPASSWPARASLLRLSSVHLSTCPAHLSACLYVRPVDRHSVSPDIRWKIPAWTPPCLSKWGCLLGVCVLGDHRQSSLHSHSPHFWPVCPCAGSGGLGPGLSLSTGWHPAGMRGLCRSPWGN